MTADIGLFLDCSNTKWLALKTWALAIWWRKTNERPGPTSPAIVSWRCRRRKYRAMNSRHLAATYWLIDSSGRRRRKKKRNVNGRSKMCVRLLRISVNALQIQLPMSVRFTRVGFFIPAAVWISYAAQAIVVTSITHDHIDLTDPVIRCGVNGLVLFKKEKQN
jgi:hypothetical protein